MLAPRRLSLKAVIVLLAFPITLIVLIISSHHTSYPISISSLKGTIDSLNKPPAARYDSSPSGETILFDHSQDPSASRIFDPTSSDPPCAALAPLAEDVLIILKTGSTEIADKFPVHINTTLRCYPHYLVFSDHAETFLNTTILDALEHVNSTIKETHSDFALWRRLKEHGREALAQTELSGPESELDPDGTGHNDNPGWKLDKWKFLPMVAKTYSLYPDNKWYIFTETDTYLLLQNVLNSLRVLDPGTPLYMGAETMMGEKRFNHGGSGFLVSQAAMKAVVDLYNDDQRRWEEICDRHWAGDAVLGEAFEAAGILPTGAAPMWQGEGIGHVPYERVGLWCAPAGTYHHLSATEVQEMWNFEQQWMLDTRARGEGTSAFLLHRDIYYLHLLPRIGRPLDEWDNSDLEARKEVLHIHSFTHCGDFCREEGDCVQYTYTSDKRCFVMSRPGFGSAAKGSEAGWLVERVEQFAAAMEVCPQEVNWLRPNTDER